MNSPFISKMSEIRHNFYLPGVLKSKWFVAIFIMTMPWMMYASVLQSWWRWDDPVLLVYALNNNIFEPLILPEVWQSLTPFNFTPLVFLSLKLDLNLFGSEPLFFYAHQLLALSGICLLSYLLFSRLVPGLWAFFGVVLFCLGPVVVTVVNQLMTRHYLEGLFFMVLALFLYVKFLNKKKILIVATGALAFFISLSAKEIFFPLALLVLFWPVDKKFLDRLKCGASFLVSLVVFLLWRSYMLGGGIDGYGIDFSALYEPIKFMDDILSALLGGGAVIHLIWLIALMPAVWLCIKSNCLLPAAIIVGSLVAPLIVVAPVVAGPDRFFLLMWWVLCMSVAVGIGKLETGTVFKFAKIFLALFLLSITFSYAQTHKESIEYNSSLFDTTGRFVWNHHKFDDILYVPQTGANDWFFWGLLDLKKKINPEYSTAIRIMSDPVEILEEGLGKNSIVWVYESETQTISRFADLEESIFVEFKDSLRDFDFQVNMSYKKGLLSWSFDPNLRGSYYILYRFSKNVTGIHPLPPEGSMRMPLSRDLKFRVKLKMKDGMHSYSPWATLYHDVDNNISWNILD